MAFVLMSLSAAWQVNMSRLEMKTRFFVVQQLTRNHEIAIIFMRDEKYTLRLIKLQTKRLCDLYT